MGAYDSSTAPIFYAMKELTKRGKPVDTLSKLKEMQLKGKFKIIPNFTEYGVTYHGRVWSRKWNRFLKPSLQAGGYLFVRICNDQGKKKTLRLHQIVMLAFVGPVPPEHMIRHLDGNPKNNHIDNLKYGTAQENVNDKKLHGTHRARKLTKQEIKEIREKFKPMRYTYRMLADEYQVAASTIYRALRK